MFIAALGHAHRRKQALQPPLRPEPVDQLGLLPVRQPVRVGAQAFFHDLGGRLADVGLELHLPGLRLHLSQHVLQLPDAVGQAIDSTVHGKASPWGAPPPPPLWPRISLRHRNGTDPDTPCLGRRRSGVAELGYRVCMAVAEPDEGLDGLLPLLHAEHGGVLPVPFRSKFSTAAPNLKIKVAKHTGGRARERLGDGRRRGEEGGHPMSAHALPQAPRPPASATGRGAPRLASPLTT